MILLVLGLLLGIAYLLYIAIAARGGYDQDESPREKQSPLLPLRRIR